ncbi:hypothetical protein IQ07DRAFT_114453 [Pyrenochaeta sp. DS3sAY3a]|nr:hypothetical protein IQ07DRAFT_114453 [Pyrenochaeta sp. DS3sAY3a]
MSSASRELEASLLQRWFPASPPGSSVVAQPTRFSETDLRGISDVLQRVGRGTWSRIPRIFTVLRLLDRLDAIDHFLAQAISDVYFPFTHRTLPQSLNPSIAHDFLQLQRVVLSTALDLERETGRHRHFSSTNDVPFIKVEDLGKGAYGFVDRVISTISYKEYARKLIPRGRTFQRDQKILRDFERELGTLKKLGHHRHIVKLIGSYTDPRFVGILMSPVAECDLKEFLHNCASDAKGTLPSKSFIRSFFGCLTSALSYLHDNTVRHKDIKPQNVLVSQQTVFLTDFGISLDWSEIGQSTTTGPTPRTARYCAPEVSDCAPRNSSSDMWSLGCIFLEIWTVLKGETISNLHAFLEATNTKSSCYHLNCEAAYQWMEKLELTSTLADNPPRDWIRHLVVPDQRERWTARQLLSEIETVNANPEVKFAFSGQCCMDELESAESVMSSDESFHDGDADRTVLPSTLPVSQSTVKLAREDQPRPLYKKPNSKSEIALTNIDDVPARLATLDLQAEDLLAGEEKTTKPSASDGFENRELNEANTPSVDIGQSIEKSPYPNIVGRNVLSSRGNITQDRAVDPERRQLDRPEVFLLAKQSLLEAIPKDSCVEKTRVPHDNADINPLEQLFKLSTDSAASYNIPTNSTKDVKASLIGQGTITENASRPLSAAYQPQSEQENQYPLPPSKPLVSILKKPSSNLDLRSKKVCGRCFGVLTGKFVRAFSSTFHEQCFTCVDCNQLVAHKFFPSPGKITDGRFVAIANPPEDHTEQIPLCERDYFRRMDLLCRTCGEALRGSYISALNSKYHPEHFVCEEPGCMTTLGTVQCNYYEHKDKVYCEPHWMRLYAELCCGCGIAICEQFVEKLRSGQTQFWHPDCYMVHKYWALELRNEFADAFAKREQPLENGLVVPQNVVDASRERSSKLISQVLEAMKTFENSFVTPLSDLISSLSQPNHFKTLSICGHLVYKIEGLFMALDEVDRVSLSKLQQGIPMEQEQKMLCNEMLSIFWIARTETYDENEDAKEIQPLLQRLADNLCLLIRIGLAAACSSDTSDKDTVISAFLAKIEQINIESSIEDTLYVKIRGNVYLSSNADLCYLCQKRVDGEGVRTTSCYWTHKQIYHIDCIKCPVCDSSPRVAFTTKDQLSVECSHCNQGSILAFISRNLGADFVILHSRSLIRTHLLYVAWARLAQTLKPDTPPWHVFADQWLASNAERNLQ